MDEMQINPTTYIKSNIATVKNLLSFLSALLFIIVAVITSYVILNYKETRDNRFEKANEFRFELSDGAATLIKFVDQKATTCEIPSDIKYGNRTYPVTIIGENAFAGNSILTEVIIPDSITMISGNTEKKIGAFSGCTNLKTVEIGEGVKRIGAYAFKNCIALTEITIPANVQFVSDGAFQNCLALDTIQLDGNGSLEQNAFENCLYVTNLKLADNVKLNDNARKSLSKLTRLEKLDINDTHQFYQYDAENNCLLAKTEVDNDTLVFAGINAKVPASVTRIVDWSFGERTPELIYVPSSVTRIAAHAFNKNAICTEHVDIASIPSGWEININTEDGNAVYTNAKLCTFNADGNVKPAYVYNDSEGEVLPNYIDLFPEVNYPTPFKEWIYKSELNYSADYESINKSTDDVLKVLESDLNKAISSAETYVVDLETAKKFKIDFWEEFKTIYYRAKNLSIVNLYDYEVNFYIEKLNYYSDIVRQVLLSNTFYEDFKVNKDWKIELKNIVDAVNRLDSIDLDASNDQTLIKYMNDYLSDAEKILAGGGGFSETYLMQIKDLLRGSYESLVVDNTENSPLGREIKQAEDDLKNKDAYTKKTWRELERCLNDAYKITNHSLNISVVRKALDAARADLHEVGFEEDKIHLQTWMSISQDLNSKDYETTSYETLNSHVKSIDLESLKTRSEINDKFELLYNAYNNLELIEYLPETEPTILNFNTLPYFIIAVILFTGAVVSGSFAVSLKHQMRSKK